MLCTTCTPNNLVQFIFSYSCFYFGHAPISYAGVGCSCTYIACHTVCRPPRLLCGWLDALSADERSGNPSRRTRSGNEPRLGVCDDVISTPEWNHSPCHKCHRNASPASRDLYAPHPGGENEIRVNYIIWRLY